MNNSWLTGAREIDSVFTDLLRLAGDAPDFSPQAARSLAGKGGILARMSNAETQGFLPRVDVREDNDAIYFDVELPGVKKEDVKLTFEKGLLTITGERKNRTEKCEGKNHLVEQSYGRFTRSFQIDSQIEVDKIGAKYEDGQLQVTLPKKEEEKRVLKEISIS
jgi:HSP20 family protein